METRKIHKITKIITLSRKSWYIKSDQHRNKHMAWIKKYLNTFCDSKCLYNIKDSNGDEWKYKFRQIHWNTGCSTSSKQVHQKGIAAAFWRLHCRTDWEVYWSNRIKEVIPWYWRRLWYVWWRLWWLLNYTW